VDSEIANSASAPQVVRFNPNDRRHFIGGSDARIIMGDVPRGPRPALAGKRGELPPPDFSQNLIVQLGSVTEELNRLWFERCTGQHVKDVQKRVRHPINKWMGATLDGVVEETEAVFEAKFMLPWAFAEDTAAAKHMAQLQHNMWVTNSRTALTLDRHRRRQMGGDQDPCRSALPAPPHHRGKEILALRTERRSTSPVRR